MERLTGTGPAAAIPVIYDLTAPHDFPGANKTPSGKFTIAEPTGVLMFDTQKILVRPSGAEGPTFINAKWSDNIPKLLQARIIQSFENADLLRSVVKPMEGLTDANAVTSIALVHMWNGPAGKCFFSDVSPRGDGAVICTAY